MRTLIASILARKPEDVSYEAWIGDELARTKDVESKIRSLARLSQETQNEFGRKMAEIESQRRQVQAACPHYTTVVHDDYEQCDHCGAYT